MSLRRTIVSGWVLLCLMVGLTIPTVNAQTPVATELLLLADVSGSLDDTDFNLQAGGYAAAFQSAGIKAAVATYGPIAVSLVYWSDGQSVAVPWTLIDDAADCDAFAAAILAAPRSSSGNTRMAAAMNYGFGLFNNGFDGARQVIDVSGDGADTDNGYWILNAPNVQAARDAAVASGVDQINALWIDDRDFFGDDPTDTINAEAYGSLNVLAGTGAFQDVVQDYQDFQDDVFDKIYREIQPVPEGGATALLLGMGLVVFGALRRRLG